MHTYEIMLANGDMIFYRTSMSFEKFKNMINENEWIEIERRPWVSNPSGGWSSRPPNALYQTKSIVYINWDEEQEKIDKRFEQRLEEQMPIKKERVIEYIPKECSLYSFRLDDNSKNVLAWYKLNKNFNEEWFEESFLNKEVYDSSMKFEDINRYKQLFATKEDCQKYCDWLKESKSK